jgi:hypothetical protein
VPGCNVLDLSEGLGAKNIFNSVAELQKLVKCVENHRKFRKNAKPILLDSI